MAFEIRYAKPTHAHFTHLSVRQQKRLFDAVDAQLTHEPSVETKQRKRMRPNRLATWELRIGELRAYYDVLPGSPPVVLIVAVGIKERNIVWIGGEVTTL